MSKRNPASMIVIILMGCLASALAVGMTRPQQSQALATVSGTVDSSTPFKAAQVYIRNVDKRILYMVYTNGGQFRAVSLFPGNYEVSVLAKGLESDVQKLLVKTGDSAKLKLSLRAAKTNAPAAEELPYDTVYPPGPGRDVAERTCIVCHQENFLPTRPGSEAVWKARLDRMMGTFLPQRPAASYAEGLLSYRNSALGFSRKDRDDLMAYLLKNFGPEAKPRSVRVEQEIPLDETKLGKAMYIEYYLPPDAPGKGVNAPEYANLQGVAFAGRRTGQDVRFDHDGNVWLTDRSYPHRLVKLDPRSGEQKDYVLPDPKNGIHEVMIDPSGMIWLPEHSGTQPESPKRLLAFNPESQKFEQAIPMDPDNVIKNPIKWLQSLALDSKNNIYVGWIMGGAISKYDRQTKKVTVFPVPQINAIVYGVVADRNDNIWMALWDSGNIAKFDTKTNGWTIFTAPTYPGHVRRLNVDAQNNIWWGIYSAGKRAGKLAKLDQTTGKIAEVTIPRQNANPYDVMQDPEGSIWSADAGGSAAALWKFNPKDSTFVLYPKPQATADTPKIQVTKDGAVWYSPRGSQDAPAFGVLYPDMNKIPTLGAYYLNGPPGYPYKLSAPARSGN